MGASNWNLYLERLLAADLTCEEHQLALALGRLLLGWKRTTAPLGRQHLRDRAGLHGRSFERALAGLVEKEIVSVSGGGVGRGNRATYTLVLQPTEKAAQKRPNESVEKAAQERPNPPQLKGRAQRHKKAAQERPRIGSGKGSTPAHSAERVDANELRQQAFDAYLSTGGILELDRERGALARAITAAVTAGTEPAILLAACRDLGREHAFPGYLKQRIADISATGGICTNQGADRAALTPRQLDECSCTTCTKWAQAIAQMAAPEAAATETSPA